MHSELHEMNWMKFSKNGGPINKQDIVFAAADQIGKDKGAMGLPSYFSAQDIQRKLFPKVRGYRAKESGISGAIQGLKRRGLIETTEYGVGWYRKSIKS